MKIRILPSPDAIRQGCDALAEANIITPGSNTGYDQPKATYTNDLSGSRLSQRGTSTVHIVSFIRLVDHILIKMYLLLI